MIFFVSHEICIGIPYEDDDYRDNNGDYDDDRQNDLRDMRPYDHQNGNRFNQLHDMNRQTNFDVGGGRDPPEYFRGYAQSAKPFSQFQPQIQPHVQPHIQPHVQPQQPQQAQQSQQPQQPYDARVGGFGYNPYGQYTYNPYGYHRPGYYWGRPTQSADPWRGSSYGLGFPFNLLLGGGGGRPWWSATRFPFGLF